jgi:hypothetical protein
MCEPATITAASAWLAANAGTVALVSAAGTALSTGLQIKAAKDSAEAQNEAIAKSTVDNYAALNRQAVEDRENVTMQTDQIRREMRVRSAQATAGAAANDIGGLSVDALLLDLSGKGLEAATSAEMNYARSQGARGDQMKQVYSTGRSQAAQVRNVGAADYIGAGLKIGNSVMGAADTYNKAAKVRGTQ